MKYVMYSIDQVVYGGVVWSYVGAHGLSIVIPWFTLMLERVLLGYRLTLFSIRPM